MIARPGDFESSQKPPTSPAKRFWTIADLLTWTEGHFKKLEIPRPRLDAELLLAHAMGSSRIELYTGYHRVVEEKERTRYRELVARRSKLEPVAYILGKREFFSLDFEVSSAVLIPRPETEHLVECALDAVRSTGETSRILDIGTGSGNVVVSILKSVQDASAVAIDISPAALEIAARNAARHGVAERLELLEGDVFAPLEEPASDRGPFDAIVSNPPYVRPDEFGSLMRDVRDYEPRDALVDSKRGDGLGYYRAIVGGARRHLKPGGLLGFEVGAEQARAVERLLGESGWREIHARADYAGIPRIVSARA